MNIGKLRHRVVIETPTDTRTDAGSTTQAWATHAILWARILETGSGETVTAAQTQTKTTHKVQVRHLDTITAKMRVNDSDKSRILNIVAIEGDPTDAEYMWLHCLEVA